MKTRTPTKAKNLLHRYWQRQWDERRRMPYSGISGIYLQAWINSLSSQRVEQELARIREGRSKLRK
jgi:hypothetical protein